MTLDEAQSEIKTLQRFNQDNFQCAVNLRRERDVALARVAELEAKLTEFQDANDAYARSEVKLRSEAARKDERIARLEAFVRGVHEHIIKAYDIDCPPAEYSRLLVEAMKEVGR